MLPPVSRNGPAWARNLLVGLYRFEAAVSIAAFALLTGAIFFDLVGRELFGRGIFVAQRVAVYCMVTAALMGFALAVGWGAHMGVDAAARLLPRRWDGTANRLADATSAAICIFLAYWSFQFVAVSFAQKSRGMSLEIVLWPIQALLIWAFASSALRFVVFAVHPQLRPRPDDLPTIEPEPDQAAPAALQPAAGGGR